MKQGPQRTSWWKNPRLERSKRPPSVLTTWKYSLKPHLTTRTRNSRGLASWLVIKAISCSLIPFLHGLSSRGNRLMAVPCSPRGFDGEKPWTNPPSSGVFREGVPFLCPWYTLERRRTARPDIWMPIFYILEFCAIAERGCEAGPGKIPMNCHP